MADMVDVNRNVWVERALGYVVDDGTPHSAFRRAWRESFDAYRDAIEGVYQQMEKLADACRKNGDPRLKVIADEGLPGVVGDVAEPLMQACVAVDDGDAEGSAAASKAALTAVQAFLDHLKDPQVAGCDANPLGVPVAIEATLAPALRSLEDALRLA